MTEWKDGTKRVSYLCQPQCGFWTYREHVYMEHLSKCAHVAQWISGWATRMCLRNETAQRG